MKAIDQPFLTNMIVNHKQYYVPMEITKINNTTKMGGKCKDDNCYSTSMYFICSFCAKSRCVLKNDCGISET